MMLLRILICIISVLSISGAIFNDFAYAETAAVAVATSTIQSKIDQRTRDIESLEKEIAQYEGQINTLNDQADSLSSTIKSLDLTKKKIDAQTALTEDKIAAANIAIGALGSRIADTEIQAAADKRSVLRAFSLLRENDRTSVPAIFLSSGSISEAWDASNKLGILANSLMDDISGLHQSEAALTQAQQSKKKAQANLVDLKADLKGQRAVVAVAVNEKSDLLADTKQSQSSFQSILNEKKALKNAFEQEMLSYESSLHLNVDSGQLPAVGSNVLSWPLDNVFITQYFGNTPFASANPQIYNGKGHTGVDFRASIGTPIKAALSGTISGVGNTDLVRGCYSYGKWVMIKHPNGLSSLYGHMSVQNVKVGDPVSTGSVIGYSGNTGYSTGPHLHFGLYATAGVAITTFTNSKNCKGAVIPLADWSAYLNPLSYLEAVK